MHISWRHTALLLWIAALLFGVALYLFPVSTRLTRLAAVCCASTLWFGLLVLLWRGRAMRLAWTAVTLLIACFFVLPARARPTSEELRQDYAACLRRYDGVRYYWGGESARGIDCSGLIRRGLIDTLALRGLRTADAGLVRQALHLWWHDCTAEKLGEAHAGLTTRVAQATTLNQLDHSLLVPGDLAVTSSGMHILAYLGDRRWIEADPAELRVMELEVPSTSAWFQMSMNIVRWELLR